MAVTLYIIITVTGQLPNIFSCLSFLQSRSVYSGHRTYNGHLAISQGMLVCKVSWFTIY